jgi:DNA-binding transcriptional ArsR family regulator
MEDLIINAFSNPTRVKILCCLANNKKSVQELVGTCELAQSAISQHLAKLKKAGLVKDMKQGKYVYYSVANKKIATIAMMLSSYCKEVSV